MNQALIEHLKRLNPSGIKWDDMTKQQKEELTEKWNEVASAPKNLNCTCPRHFCENNHNCQFCILTHRYYGSLPDCLRRVDDLISEGIPPEKRHNIHAHMNNNQSIAINREEYARRVSEGVKADPNGKEAGKKRAAEWHALVRDPKNLGCSCPRTDCLFHGNCTKCCAVHRAYDGFPHCCQFIHDKIDAAVQAYRAEQAKEA